MPQKKIRLGIIDRETSYREGLIALLANFREFQICFEASNSKEVHQRLRKYPVDLILLDLNVNEFSSEDIFDYLSTIHPTIKVIILTSIYTEYLVKLYIKKKALSMLPKSLSFEEIVKGIKIVNSGHHYFDQLGMEVLTSLVHFNQNCGIQHLPCEPDFNWSEIQVIKLMCRRLETKQIAQILGRQPRTIEFNRYQIWQKSGIVSKSIDALILFALKHEIIRIL